MIMLLNFPTLMTTLQHPNPKQLVQVTPFFMQKQCQCLLQDLFDEIFAIHAVMTVKRYCGSDPANPNESGLGSQLPCCQRN
jgi:hypothetical protein